VERVRAIEAHAVSERPPIRVAVGDAVSVGERDTDWPAFVFVTAGNGAGWVPSRYLSSDSGDAVVAVAYDTAELATEIGDVLEVVERDNVSGWHWCRADDGREGWVPTRTLADQPG
jgi:hypothetical protein